MRGRITNKIRIKAHEILGIKNISTDELRLMYYIHQIILVNHYIYSKDFSKNDMLIIKRWREEGWIKGEKKDFFEVSKEFYDAISEILWLFYVAYDPYRADGDYIG